MPALAQLTDISNAPIASSSNLSVLPNIMFLLDDSGSMTYDALPDHADHQQGPVAAVLAQASTRASQRVF